jgi:ABC-type dipeptide/oligopeptide/nickel transport system ATPase component
MASDPLLEVRDLRVAYHGEGGPLQALDGVSFALDAGETVALVGESGSGKTAIALSLMRLLPRNGLVDAGSRITFDGHDMLSIDDRTMRDLRGRRLSMIFQEPMSALNPVMTVGSQVAEVARVHGERSARAAWRRAVAMLERTGIASADRYARRYPHQLSGGMRQRVLIAMALLLGPALVIADEPTSALDVTVQAQILDLLRELQRETGMAVLFITHDFGVVAETCSRALVMLRGHLVEDAPVERLFHAPQHAYTAELLRAVPKLSARA